MPSSCFCGCGADRGPDNAPNAVGLMLAYYLGAWLQATTITREAGGELDGGVDRFLEDGASSYRSIYGEVHQGESVTKKELKQVRRWIKAADKRMTKVKRRMSSDAPDPFSWEAAAPGFPEQIRAFALEGKSLEI